MSKDKYNIDSHKLMYHVPRVNDWLSGKNIYPIYMEVSPAGACNHRCKFCAVDFMEYQNRKLDTDIFKDRLKELGNLAVKSIMYAGEGEPFLHPDMAEIATETKASGIDVSFTTNAVLLKEKIADEVLSASEWIKVSINAGTADVYSDVHQTKPGDFDKVVDNLKIAAKKRRDNDYKCVLGMQMLLLPENANTVETLAQVASDIGMDYLVVKPYSKHPLSETCVYDSVKYDQYDYLAEKLEKYNSEHFNVIFRQNAMAKWDSSDKPYSCCLALPFWSYIDAGGNVWGCSMFLGDNTFFYGNINEQSFEDIWNGQKRIDSLKYVAEKLDATNCRVNCRMDEINKYLWKLKEPPQHVNFI